MLTHRPSITTLFPYTTLFRSSQHAVVIVPDFRYLKLRKDIGGINYDKSIGIDLDGTIIDTEKALFKSYKQVFLHCDCDLILDVRSEEHTSELQSRFDLVCLLL